MEKTRVSLGLRKGAWTAEEDRLLKNHIQKFGEGKWHLVPLKAGLNRCRKSCRLRWVNYLRPDLKRGDFQNDEVDLMHRLHKLLGNRWSLIAGRLPGRTANDVKNYWNTHVRSRTKLQTEKLKDHAEPSQHAVVQVIKPQPFRLCKTLNMYPKLIPRNTGSLVTPSNDGLSKHFNLAPPLASSTPLSDDMIEEFLDELFKDSEKEMNNEVMNDEVGWCLQGATVNGGDLDFAEQEDVEKSFLDFPVDDVMWTFAD